MGIIIFFLTSANSSGGGGGWSNRGGAIMAEVAALGADVAVAVVPAAVVHPAHGEIIPLA